MELSDKIFWGIAGSTAAIMIFGIIFILYKERKATKKHTELSLKSNFLIKVLGSAAQGKQFKFVFLSPGHYPDTKIIMIPANKIEAEKAWEEAKSYMTPRPFHKIAMVPKESTHHQSATWIDGYEYFYGL